MFKACLLFGLDVELEVRGVIQVQKCDDAWEMVSFSVLKKPKVVCRSISRVWVVIICTLYIHMYTVKPLYIDRPRDRL